MRVSFYGKLADVFGESERLVDCPREGIEADDLRRRLAGDDRALLAQLFDVKVRLVVNDIIVRGVPLLRPTDEVAFLPPVSGG